MRESTNFAPPTTHDPPLTTHDTLTHHAPPPTRSRTTHYPPPPSPQPYVHTTTQNHVFHYLQRVMLSVAHFANVCATQKIYESSLHMSYCLLIASDPDYITYPSRTRQLNVREKQCFRAVDESHLLRKSRKMRSHEKIT